MTHNLELGNWLVTPCLAKPAATRPAFLDLTVQRSPPTLAILVLSMEAASQRHVVVFIKISPNKKFKTPIISPVIVTIHNVENNMKQQKKRKWQVIHQTDHEEIFRSFLKGQNHQDMSDIYSPTFLESQKKRTRCNIKKAGSRSPGSFFNFPEGPANTSSKSACMDHSGRR